MRSFILCLLTMAAAAAQPSFNVRDYGAAGDGFRKDTAAIQKAVDAASRHGGTVWFPPGRYLTGAIALASHITLDIGAGATLLGSPDPADYPLRASPWGEGQEISALIYGDGLVNIALRGRGTIDGQGAVWWERQKAARGGDRKVLPYGRPHLIKLVRSKDVLLEDLTLINSPSWTVNPVFCEFVNIRGLTILNPDPSPNTDGINPESCRNVHISNCHIDVGDDCITIKSGKDEAGRKAGKPCENIAVTNCTMIHGHGGVVVGSEMSGGARNISVSNCTFQNTQRGIRIKSQRGRGGVVEGIVVNNVVMHDVREAFSITMYYSGKAAASELHPVNEGTPRFRDILISNITARGSRSVGEIAGLREMPISGVTFANVRVAAERGFSISQARDIAFHNVQFDSEKGPALLGDTVDGLELDGFRTARAHPDAPVIDLTKILGLYLRGCSTPRDTATFLRVRETPAAELVVGENNLGNARLDR